jgi:hypothetical protein
MSVGSVGGVESQPGTTSVEQGVAAGRRPSGRTRHRLIPASVTPAAVFGSRLPARSPPGSRAGPPQGGADARHTVKRAALAASNTGAAGGFAEGSRSSGFGHQASSHRDVRARAGEPSGPPGTSVPPQPRTTWSVSPGCRESRTTRSPSRREASASSRARAVAARTPRRQGGDSQGLHLGGGAGTPGRETDQGGARACVRGPAREAGRPAQLEATAERGVTTRGQKAAVTRYGYWRVEFFEG